MGLWEVCVEGDPFDGMKDGVEECTRVGGTVDISVGLKDDFLMVGREDGNVVGRIVC
jgi:hypothetical protein